VRPDEVDLRWAGAMLYRNEGIEETGLAGGVLNNPANGVAWLANKIAPHGDSLKAGELILAGSFTRPLRVYAGDSVFADYGVMFDDTVYASGAEIPVSLFSNVRIEVELAFVLATALEGPDCTLDHALAAIEYAVPALEVLNSHIELEGRTIVDTISDNAAMGAMVVGGRPVRPDALDLRWVSALLSRNEVIEESGVAAAVLGHPALGVAWLANKLAQHGQALEGGEIILAGSFTRPMWVQRGDTVHADYHELGTVTCRFE